MHRNKKKPLAGDRNTLVNSYACCTNFVSIGLNMVQKCIECLKPTDPDRPVLCVQNDNGSYNYEAGGFLWNIIDVKYFRANQDANSRLAGEIKSY